MMTSKLFNERDTESEFPVTINCCCFVHIFKHYVLKIWLVRTVWSCWFLCMTISSNSLGAWTWPGHGRACVPTSWGKAQAPLQTGKLFLAPAVCVRNLCSYTLCFFALLFTVRLSLAELWWFHCCSGSLQLGHFMWVQSEEKKS